MPIVTVQAVQRPSNDAIARMLGEIRAEGALALGCSPSNLWVQFLPLAPEHYLQDERAPLVTVRANRGRSLAQKTELARASRAAVARALDVTPQSVWIHYQELNPEEIL